MKYIELYVIEGVGRVTEVMDAVAETVAPLEKIVEEIAELTESGGKYNEAPHVIEVTLPLLCRFVIYPHVNGLSLVYS